MRVPAARATTALAAIKILCFVALELSRQTRALEVFGGFIPMRMHGLVVTGAAPLWLTPLTATLIHAGILHLMFNLVMLIFCGREDEVALGAPGVIVLYLVGAYAAAAGQYLADPMSLAPMVGSSGAVSALVGAYALLYGRSLPSRLPPEVARWLHILWLAVAWIGIQLLLGLAWRSEGIAIAAAAHIGGFLAGLLLARPLLRWRYRKA